MARSRGLTLRDLQPKVGGSPRDALQFFQLRFMFVGWQCDSFLDYLPVGAYVMGFGEAYRYFYKLSFRHKVLTLRPVLTDDVGGEYLPFAAIVLNDCHVSQEF